MKNIVKILLLVALATSLFGCSVNKNYNNCAVCGYYHTPGHTTELNFEMFQLVHTSAQGMTAKQWRVYLQKLQGSAHRGESASFRRHLWYHILVNHMERNVCFPKSEIVLTPEAEELEDPSHHWTTEELLEYDNRIKSFPNIN